MAAKTSAEEYQEARYLAANGQTERAHALLVECVRRDPTDLNALELLLETRPRTARGVTPGAAGPLDYARLPPELQRARKHKNWSELLTLAPLHLADPAIMLPTISAAAEAAADEGWLDHELAYLRAAREAAPDDPSLLRRQAKALADGLDFAQALDLWRQLETLAPDDPEPPAEIARLTVAAARQAGGLADQFHEPVENEEAGRGRSPRRMLRRAASATEHLLDDILGVHAKLRHLSMQQLEAAVRESPAAPDNYLRLAAIYLEKGRDYDAERLLAQGRQETGDDSRIRHLWEDTRMTRLQTKIDLARRHAEIQKTPDVQAELESLCQMRDRMETEIFSNRCDRDPQNAALHFQLGTRLARNGSPRTACHHFREALHDPRHACAASFQLGECLRELKEPREAMRYYRLAADSPADADAAETKGQALFRAGELAADIRMLRLAQRYLSAALRFSPQHAAAKKLLEEVRRQAEDSPAGVRLERF